VKNASMPPNVTLLRPAPGTMFLLDLHSWDLACTELAAPNSLSFVLSKYCRRLGSCSRRYLYTCSINDVISSVRKHYCTLGLELPLELRLRLVEICLCQTYFRASVVNPWWAVDVFGSSTGPEIKPKASTPEIITLPFGYLAFKVVER